MSDGELNFELPQREVRPLVPSDFHFHRVLDSLVEGFQTIAEDWTYTYVNPAAAAHGRSSPEALIGKKMWEAYPGIEETELFATLSECMRSRKPSVLENQFTFADGTSRWFELYIEPIVGGLCVHSRDVDERRRSQDALARMRLDLEEQLSARANEIMDANQELQAFSYSISHHLRSPLRALDGFSRALLERYEACLDDRAQDYLQRIRRASQRMDELIAAMLLLVRISSLPCTRSEVNLSRVAAEIAAELREKEPERQVDFRSEHELRAWCDPGLVRILLHHLLSNAWKFTSHAELPIVRFGRGDAPKTFVVSDNGVGFDVRYVDKLFVLFQRLHDQEEFSGTGTGLAIVARIIRKHGGQVRIDAKLGGGTRVTFGFGANKAEQAAAPSE